MGNVCDPNYTMLAKRPQDLPARRPDVSTRVGARAAAHPRGGIGRTLTKRRSPREEPSDATHHRGVWRGTALHVITGLHAKRSDHAPRTDTQPTHATNIRAMSWRRPSLLRDLSGAGRTMSSQIAWVARASSALIRDAGADRVQEIPGRPARCRAGGRPGSSCCGGSPSPSRRSRSRREEFDSFAAWLPAHYLHRVSSAAPLIPLMIPDAAKPSPDSSSVRAPAGRS